MAIYIVDHDLPYDTYDVYFFGDSIRTTVTHDPAVAANWISEVESINQSRIVGLDAEWRPPANGVRNTTPPVATLQLCVGRRCLIFQLIHCPSIPSRLVEFLANPDYTFVGVEVRRDLEKLENDYGFGIDANAADLRDLAAEKYGDSELKRAGLKRLAKIVLGKDVEKPLGVTLSEWDNEWLTRDQVQYACVDAFVCFEIGRILMNASYSSSISASGYRLEGLNRGGLSSGGGNSSSKAQMEVKDKDEGVAASAVAVGAAAGVAALAAWGISKWFGGSPERKPSPEEKR